MNEMIITNAEFGSIRIEMRNGEPWFIGSSVAKVLKYQNQQKAIRDHVDAEDKLTEQIVLAGQRREVTLINESGLYSLILSSKMEEAKRFKHWITSEVLPAIRKTGGYQQTAPQGKELLALAVLEAQKTIEEQNRTIERMRPKEIFADAVSASKTSILIGDLAKLIKQNGVDIGEKRLFQWMREHGYLIRERVRGANGQLGSIEYTILEQPRPPEPKPQKPERENPVRISRTPKVTGKGQRYFVNKILSAMT